MINLKNKHRIGKLKIANLSPIQIQKLREYEKEIGAILIAYQNKKENNNGKI
jgi:hypothetical protein